jgi:hypothetical protein
MFRTQPVGRFACPLTARFNGACPPPTREKITFGEMRAAGVRGLLIY